jgi:tRNA (mo5U34)-methyltransferase
MLDFDSLYGHLARIGLRHWATPLDTLLRQRVGTGAHGNMAGWLEAIGTLPRVTPVPATLNDEAVAADAIDLPADARNRAIDALRALAPWRKGPFRIGDIVIDTEWRSNLKWDRLSNAISPLEGRLVLDAGCGNGYYSLRMRGAGAVSVIGVDPTLVYLAQFRAIMHFLEPEPVHVLPLRLEELPPASRCFDTAFSMGVLYHSRAPIDHLRQLRDALRRGGELVLETIVLPGDQPLSRTPPDRYARMRNVWHLPTIPELLTWLRRAGFRHPDVVDVTMTTIDEQRRTDWMPFDSLAEALDPADPSKTVEGWPAPHRATIIAATPD